MSVFSLAPVFTTPYALADVGIFVSTNFHDTIRALGRHYLHGFQISRPHTRSWTSLFSRILYFTTSYNLLDVVIFIDASFRNLMHALRRRYFRGSCISQHHTTSWTSLFSLMPVFATSCTPCDVGIFGDPVFHNSIQLL